MDLDTAFLIQSVMAIVSISDGYEITLQTARLLAQLIPCDDIWLSELGVAATAVNIWRRGDPAEGPRVADSTHQLDLKTGRAPRSGRLWNLVRHRWAFTDTDVRAADLLLPVIVCLDELAQERGAAAHPTECEESVCGVKLSSREQMALSLVAEGLTAAAIGRRMRIAASTVRKHLEHAYAKLGYHDRLTAVAHARDLGLLADRAAATVAASGAPRSGVMGR